MKRNALLAATLAVLVAVPVFAGALTLEVSNANSSPEAQSKNAVAVARITACQSPEKTVVTATAEGIVEGKRTSMPLKVLALLAPGTFAVTHEWPAEGIWTVRFEATNPDYRNYATGVVVPVHKDGIHRAEAKPVYHATTEQDVNSALKQATLE
jgi:hypothetical protein